MRLPCLETVSEGKLDDSRLREYHRLTAAQRDRMQGIIEALLQHCTSVTCAEPAGRATPHQNER